VQTERFLLCVPLLMWCDNAKKVRMPSLSFVTREKMTLAAEEDVGSEGQCRGVPRLDCARSSSVVSPNFGR